MPGLGLASLSQAGAVENCKSQPGLDSVTQSGRASLAYSKISEAAAEQLCGCLRNPELCVIPKP